MSGPVPVWSRRRSPGDVFQRIVHGSREAGRFRRTLRSKLSGGEREQQWYARPAKLFFAGKPCGFNTIGGIADTRHAFESRTKEQGLRKVAAPMKRQVVPESHPEASGAPRRTTRDAKDAKGALCRRWRVC